MLIAKKLYKKEKIIFGNVCNFIRNLIGPIELECNVDVFPFSIFHHFKYEILELEFVLVKEKTGISIKKNIPDFNSFTYNKEIKKSIIKIIKKC